MDPGDELYEDVDNVKQNSDPQGKKVAFGICYPNPVWYHGKLNRREAEDKLRGCPSGSYVIRDSTSSPYDFVLTACESPRVSHYVITRQQTGEYIVGEQAFKDIVEIIDFYKVHLLDTAVLTAPLPLDHALSNQSLNSMWIFKMECMYNFVARDTEDLSFRKGDVLHILDMHEEQWWRAQSISSLQIGVVPVNYLKEIERGPCAPPLLQAKPGPKPLQRMESFREPEVVAPPPPPHPQKHTRLPPSSPA
jgi:hypothetical protein